ncbi:calcium-binding protein [Marimonas lutisalis]|uniref:calcium-binding protein n=1 Tax=Marimonas lutisalis TaxID=2545756 RepID=UPI0010F6FD06|nr:calcium-binding protein [Marimonas lutisalis]
MATITYLAGANTTDMWLPSVSEAELLGLIDSQVLSYGYSPGPSSYTSGDFTFDVTWYVGESHPEFGVFYYYYFSGITFQNAISIELDANYTVIYQDSWFEVLRDVPGTFQATDIYVDTAWPLHDFSTGDTFVGNEYDNRIFSEQEFSSLRATNSHPGFPEHYVRGDDTILAGGGNDIISTGYGSDSVSGGSGFDFYEAFGHRSEQLFWWDWNNSGIPDGLSWVLPDDVGILINVSSTSLNLASILGQISAPDGADFNVLFPQLSVVSSLAAGSSIDSFQLSDETPDELESIEGVQGSNYDDLIVASNGNGETHPDWGTPGGLAYGQGGDDVMISSAGTLFMAGGQGSDLMIGREGNDVFNGDEDDDSIFGGAGGDALWGGHGVDYLDGQDDFDWFNTYNEGAGVRANLSVDSFDLNFVFSQTNYGDAVLLIPATISALIGERTIYDASSIYESAGTTDTIVNVEGVNGTPYGDVLIAYGASDYSAEGMGPGGLVYGENGDDLIVAGDGTSFASGGLGNDLIVTFGESRVYANGDENDDIMLGGQGEDHFQGGSGNDHLYGGAGSDDLYGDEDHDVIHGGAGADELVGGEGNDTMFGGAGGDLFTIERGSDSDHGNNHIYSGTTETDSSDLLGNNIVDYGSAAKSLFAIRWQAPASGPGFQITVTHESGGTDVLHFMDTVRFQNGAETFTQADIAAAGFLGHMAMALNGAFEAIGGVVPPEFGSEGFQRFFQWLSLAETVAELGAEWATQDDLESAIRRAFVVGAREAFDHVAGQTRDWVDENVLSHLPQSIRDEANTRMDEIQARLRQDTLEAADSIGAAYAQASQDLGEAIGEYLFDLYDSMNSSIEREYSDFLPNQTPTQDFQNNFNIDEIILDSQFAPPPPVTPLPSTPEQVTPTEEPETLYLLQLDSTVTGTLAALDGDTIYNFGTGDILNIEGESFSQNALTVTMGSAILDIDVDGDETPDATIRLSGDFTAATFVVSPSGNSTAIFMLPLQTGTIGDDSLEGTTGDDTIDGLAGNDSISGLSGNDNLVGGDGNDTLSGGVGADSLFGGDGDDLLRLGNGQESIDGGADNDTLEVDLTGATTDFSFLPFVNLATGQAGATDLIVPLDTIENVENVVFIGNFHVELTGDGGANYLQGGAGDDTIDGGAGDDTLFGGVGADSLFGGDGDDLLRLGNGQESIDGGAGNDTLEVDLTGATSFSFLPFINLATGQVGATDIVVPLDTVVNVENVVFIGNFHVELTGDGIGNYLQGGAGDDTIDGGAGDDTLMGDTGADQLTGGDGFDIISYAGATQRARVDFLNDVAGNGRAAAGDLFTELDPGRVVDVEGVIGTDFDDLLMTDLSNNSLDGGLGNDILRGRKGRDTMTGGDGNDELDGGKGRDRMEAGDGDDTMIGRRGLDNMRGGTGNDTLDGGTSNDILVGGRGNDVLIGGDDNDTIQGNQGDDVFVFADGHGVDIVLDFEATNDNEKLDFSGLSSISDIAAFGLAASQVGADVLIDTGGGKSILLLNVLESDLDAADVIF